MKPTTPNLQYSAHLTFRGVRTTYGLLRKDRPIGTVGYPAKGGFGFALREDLTAVLLFTTELEGKAALAEWESYNEHYTGRPPYLRGRKAVR